MLSGKAGGPLGWTGSPRGEVTNLEVAASISNVFGFRGKGWGIAQDWNPMGVDVLIQWRPAWDCGFSLYQRWRAWRYFENHCHHQGKLEIFFGLEFAWERQKEMKLEGSGSQLAGSSWVSNPLIQPFKAHQKILQPVYKCPVKYKAAGNYWGQEPSTIQKEIGHHYGKGEFAEQWSIFWKAFPFWCIN